MYNLQLDSRTILQRLKESKTHGTLQADIAPGIMLEKLSIKGAGKVKITIQFGEIVACDFYTSSGVSHQKEEVLGLLDRIGALEWQLLLSTEVGPVPTSGTFQTTDPLRISRVSHQSPPQPTSGVSYNTPPPRPTSRVSYNTPPPQPTSGVSYNTPPPQPISGVSYNTSPPQSTSGVSYNIPPPQPTSGVSYNTSPSQNVISEKLRSPIAFIPYRVRTISLVLFRDQADRKVYQLIDGQRTIGRIAVLAHIQPQDTVGIIQRLQAEGIIALKEP
jgi:hypothetical protein